MNISGAINQIRRAYAELEQKYEREPTEEELADILDMKPNEIRNTLGAEVKQTSMDAPFGEEESGSLLDVLENQTTGPTDGQMVFNDSLKVETLRALSTLTAREREVIMMSFGIALDNPFTLEEIGDAMGLTRERVRQIREKALQKLREPSKNRRLKEFCAN